MKVNVITVASAQSHGKCEHGTGACLPKEDLDFWYEAIYPDDIESVEKYLASVKEIRKRELLNGHVCAGDVEDTLDTVRGLSLTVAKKMTYTRMVNIAAVAGAQKLIEMCLQNGVSVSEQDRNGDNLIHVLIRSNTEMPQFEEKYVSIMKMLKTQLITDTLRQLLYQENNEGCRPLELAAHYGSFKLFTEILHTKDIYMKGEKNIGMLSLYYYDITEYESFKGKDTRRMKSPLWYLCHLENHRLGEASREFFSSNPVKVWCEMKVRANWPLLFLWFMMRFSMVVLSQYWDLSGGGLTMQDRADIEAVISGNVSISDVNCLIGTSVTMQSFIAPAAVSEMIRYILVGFAFMIIFFDFMEFLVWIMAGWVKRFYRTSGGGIKSVVSNALEFRILSVLCSLSCIAMFASMVMGSKTMFNMAYLTFSTLLIWAVLYFAQLVPWIGPTVINIQRLVQELLSYVVIIGVLIVPMSYTVVSLLTKNHIGPCPSEINFTDFFQTIYRGFAILLNMVNLTGYPLEEYISMYTYHLIFVFLISILILNFVIASFSTTLATLEENREAIFMIQRLIIAMQVEYRVGAVFPCLIHWLHKRTFQYCPQAEVFYVNQLKPRNGH